MRDFVHKVVLSLQHQIFSHYETLSAKCFEEMLSIIFVSVASILYLFDFKNVLTLLCKVLLKQAIKQRKSTKSHLIFC